MIWLVREVVNVDVPFTFPLWYVALAFAGTLILALVNTLIPIRRAPARGSVPG